MILTQTALLRLGLALLFGAIIGFERERGERGAGLRTHILVALGSCLSMLVSSFGFSDIIHVAGVSLDPSRVAAQVISGIGFLGAGAILLRKEMIKGLTTAGTIWIVAAIGLACGAGMLIEATFTTGLTLGVLTLLQPLRHHVRRSPRSHQLHIIIVANETILSHAYDICLKTGTNTERVEIRTGDGQQAIELECTTQNVSQLTQSLLALRNESELTSLSINIHNPTRETILSPLFTNNVATESVPSTTK